MLCSLFGKSWSDGRGPQRVPPRGWSGVATLHGHRGLVILPPERGRCQQSGTKLPEYALLWWDLLFLVYNGVMQKPRRVTNGLFGEPALGGKWLGGVIGKVGS